jgi:hypothetical protein
VNDEIVGRRVIAALTARSAALTPAAQNALAEVAGPE